MLEQVVKTISRHQMFPPGARVGVAVSGGADSVCLLHLLRETKHHWNLRITAVHLNHQLRASESDADEQFVRELCQAWGINLVADRTDVGLRVRQHGGNLEQVARECRLEFFRRVRASHDLDRIAVAHTRSDQAETVLFRLLRGTSGAGLAGIRPVSSTGIVRPLLDVTREDVLDYLRAHSIGWREDSSNQDPRFARNRIRHHLLPMLAAEWNPRIACALWQYSVISQAEEEYWASIVGQATRRWPPLTADGALVLDTGLLKNEATATARRLIRQALTLVREDLRSVEFAHIEAIRELALDAEGHGRVQVPGVDVIRSFAWIRFAPLSAPSAEREFEVAVAPPQAVRLPGADALLSLELVERPTANPHVTLKTDLDWDRVQTAIGRTAGSPLERLTLRNWRPGDSYRPAGGERERKLKEMFHGARIPLWERRGWPVLTLDGKILWSKHFGPAHGFATDADSRWVLRISH